jgi:membrane-associated protease RseP (regulator of RpoE activity)
MLGPLLTFVLIEFSVAFHELGHAIAMRAHGVEFEEFAIGYPVAKIPSFRFLFRGVKVILSPLLIGGFVKPTKRGMIRWIEELSYSEQALINGAGIMANLFFGGAIFVALYLTSGHSWPFILGRIAGIFSFLAAIWFGRRIFCGYLIPLLGFAQAVYVVASLFGHHHGSALSGPIGIGTTIVKYSGSIYQAMILGALLSVSIGLTNMLPFLPLDGGRTVIAVVRRFRPRFVKPVAVWGEATLFLLVGIACYSDIASLFSH